MEVTLQVTTTVYDQMLNVDSEHSFWLTEKKLHSEFCYTQDIIVSFSQNKTNLFWLQGDIIPCREKQPVEIRFVAENVNNLKLEKQTCKIRS